MSLKSEKQRRYIFYLRGKYKTKEKTPKKFKWIWKKNCKHIKENSLFKKYLLQLYNEVHAVTLPFDIHSIPKNELLDKLLMIIENEDEIQFKRVWNQLPTDYKLKFIKNFKGKFTQDTLDKMYFMLQALI